MTATTRSRIVTWVFQLIAAGILAQTLVFKFTASPESVYIFTKLGAEPWGRIGSGIAELVCCVLLLTPRGAVLGALGSLGVISGAIISHLTMLGLVVMDDRGLLFALACAVFACSACVAWRRRAEIPIVGVRFRCPQPCH